VLIVVVIVDILNFAFLDNGKCSIGKPRSRHRGHGGCHRSNEAQIFSAGRQRAIVERGRRSDLGTFVIFCHRGTSLSLHHNFDHQITLSVFLLKGSTGLVSWEHLGGSMKTGSPQMEPQHQYRLDPASMRSGDDWTSFRSSLLASLPHSWESAADTKVELAHYTRQHSGGRHHAAKRKGSLLGRHGGQGHPSVRMPGLASVPTQAVSPHQESEHIDSPNVLVAHSEQGVEVVLLRGGGEVLSLALPKGGVYFDINNDGSIDHLSVVGKKSSGDSHDHLSGVAALPLVRAINPRAHVSLPPCSALAVSGVPAREQLFNGSLCDGNIVGDFLFYVCDLMFTTKSSP
jgi:hypothetical protein